MPQVFQVLRCFKCLVFQVQQTKKSIKWDCKMCGEKQSMKRHYGIGTAKDCRLHVQKLNCVRGEINELKCGQMMRNQISDDEAEIDPELLNASVSPPKIAKNSKWSNYVEKPELLEEPSNEPMTLGDAEVVLEIPKKQKKQFQNYTRTTTYSKSNPILDQNKAQKRTNSNEIDEHHNYKDTAKLEPVIEFNISVVESYPSDVLTENLLLNENHKPKKSMPCKKFVPPVIDKNSKWAQFAEDEEPDITPSPSLGPSQSDNMFSLCDENDLDNILDF